MTRFDHLKSYDPTNRRAWFPLPLKPDPDHGAPQLEVLYAGTSNKGFVNAALKANAKGKRRRAQRGRVDVKALDENLALERELFPRHVVVGWEGILDGDRNPVPFDPAACRDFLEALPDWIMRDLSAFVSTADNFLDDDEPSDADFEDQAGE